MAPGSSSGLSSPRYRGLIWAILLLACGWIALVVRQAWQLPGGLDVAPLVAALMPPVFAILFGALLLQFGRTPQGIDVLEARLTTALDGANALDGLLGSIEKSLSICADQAAQLSRAADDGGGLLVGATRLSAAAQDVVQSATNAHGVAERLAATLPDLVRVSETVGAMGERFGTGIVPRLEIVDALLASVRVRGDEVAAQADAAIASMNTQLAEIDEESRQMTTRLAKRAYALDAAVDGAAARATALLDTVAATIASRIAAMDERLAAARGEMEAISEAGVSVVADRLAQLQQSGAAIAGLLDDYDLRSSHLRDGLDDHLDALPARLGAVHGEAQTAIDHLIARTDQLHDGIGKLDVPLGASRTELGSLGDVLAVIEIRIDKFLATVAGALPGTAEHVTKLDATATMLEGRISSVRADLDAGGAVADTIADRIGALRVEAAALGAEDLRIVDDRMNATAIVLADIGHRLAAYGHQSSEAKALIEGQLVELDRVWGAIHQAGGERLAGLMTSVSAVGEAIGTLHQPIGVAERKLIDLEAQVGTIGDDAAAVGSRLHQQLTATTASFAALRDEAGELTRGAAAMHESADGGSQALAALSRDFARETTAVAAAMTVLGDRFDGLRAALEVLDRDTQRTAAGSAIELGATYERARELAAANVEGLRTLLTAVVDEAGIALGERGAAVAASAFADPVRRELDTIRASADEAIVAADAAASHIGSRAVSLTATIGGLAAQIAELETTLDVRACDTLAARASRLIEMLGAASVDVTSLLSIDAGDHAWVDYLKGDRGVFARRAIRQLDRSTNDKIARHYAYDAAFTAEASHYLDVFDRLTGRLSSDPDGDALLATVVSSDLGKLYVAIARATGHRASTVQ